MMKDRQASNEAGIAVVVIVIVEILQCTTLITGHRIDDLTDATSYALELQLRYDSMFVVGGCFQAGAFA